MEKRRLAPGIVSVALGILVILSGIILVIVSICKNLYGEMHTFVFPANEGVWTLFGVFMLLYGRKTLRKTIKYNKRTEANFYF